MTEINVIAQPPAITLCGGEEIYWDQIAGAVIGQCLASDFRRDGHDEWHDDATVAWRDDTVVTVAVTTRSVIDCCRYVRTTVYVFALRGRTTVYVFALRGADA